MAGDWIKMRTALMTDPKVDAIARELEASLDVGCRLLKSSEGVMSAFVTCDVMRDVTVSRLLVLWAAANEHTKDDSISNVDLAYIDRIAGLPGFGEAMQNVGWLVYDAESRTITLENFSEYNKSRSARSAGAKSGAERQAALRARRKAEAEALALVRDGKSDVTRDVTSDRREDKRREDKENKHTGKSSTVPRAEDAVCVGLPEIPPRVGAELAYRAKQAVEAIGAHGIEVAQGHPHLQAMLVDGVTVDELSSAARIARTKGKGFQYLCGIITNQRNAQMPSLASSMPTPTSARVWDDVRSVVEAQGVRLGIGLWDEGAASVGRGEQWPAYRAKVRAAFDAEIDQVEGVQ